MRDYFSVIFFLCVEVSCPCFSELNLSVRLFFNTSKSVSVFLYCPVPAVIDICQLSGHILEWETAAISSDNDQISVKFPAVDCCAEEHSQIRSSYNICDISMDILLWHLGKDDCIVYRRSFTHIRLNRYYWSATRGLEKRRFPTFSRNNRNAVPTWSHQSALLYAVKSNWSLLNWPTTEFNKGLHSLFNSLEQCEPSYLKNQTFLPAVSGAKPSNTSLKCWALTMSPEPVAKSDNSLLLKLNIFHSLLLWFMSLKAEKQLPMFISS